ncbi:MAG: quinone-interacting membrane-bound oxidoreductase complex subunit QmoC [Desulfomonile tiedjei]|nr:quinone-interacting membrane-bound oxidoreductase complex subunit QmoC [Desulfomonile tiedjei]
MAKEFVAEPDLQFTRDVIAAGGSDVKKCYQCATCSVACPISPDNSPYPRKEMIWAQWGLKDRLVNDPDIWLCHHCNDCSTQCPRGANPGDLMKAVRKMVIEENSWPSFLGGLVGQPSLMVLTLGIPVAVVLFLVYINGGFRAPQPLNYGEFINYLYIQGVYTFALVFAVVSMVLSLKKYWANLEANCPINVGAVRKPFVPSLIEAFKEILPHDKFKECEANNIRYASHLMVFWGMIGLFVTTAIVAFNIDILHIAPPSRGGPGTVPIKILGNVSAIAFVLGLGIMIVRRITQPDQAGNSSYFDWLFLFVIFGTGATGLLTELVRWAGSAPGAYFLYAVHLMFVLALLLYLPFSKFAHIGYRTLAIAWGKSAGRDVTLPVVPNYAPVPAQEGGAEETPQA